jgi:hypothetical protein
MADNSEHHPISLIETSVIKPYGSFTILECPADHGEAAFALLATVAKRISRDVRVGTVAVVHTGLSGSDQYLNSRQPGGRGVDQAGGFVYRTMRPPSWAMPDSPYEDVAYELALVVRCRNLLALSGDGALRKSVARWLQRNPQQLLSIVDPDILQGAFLSGEGKVLWLRGAHAPRTTKPDSKQLSGRHLQEALNPLDDNSFAMISAKAAMPTDGNRIELTGNVGTTPAKGTVWSRGTDSFAAFIRMVSEVLETVEQTLASGGGLARPFPILTVSTSDLSEVTGAYDIACALPESLPADPDVDPAALAAARLLERSVMIVHGHQTDAAFTIAAGLDGAIGGSILAQPSKKAGGVHFEFGPYGSATHPDSVRQVVEALRCSNDLFVVYYDSGHTISAGSIVSPSTRPEPYRAWDFRDFTGFDITREKPDGASVQEIHCAVGLPGDTSLFGWVAANYASGYLICDDGPGEVADFLHIAYDCTLTFIHVKAANTSSPARVVAVGAYEVVASQAVKNLTVLTTQKLRERVESPKVPSPACWVDGERVGDRTQFLDALEYVGPRDDKRVVIVQPHISKALYDRLKGSGGARQLTCDQRRLQLLETLLNASRSATIYVGGDMSTIASLV